MIELALLLKATVVLALGLTAAALTRRARASVRHLWIAATLGAIGALPVVALAVPGVIILLPHRYAAIAPPIAAAAEIPNPVTPVRPPGPATAAAPPASTFRWTSALRLAWIGGAALALAGLAVSLGRVRRIRREGVPRPEWQRLTRELAADAGVARRIDVLEHELVPAPLTCGFWRPAIVLPRDAREWDEAAVRRALVHEMEHVARGDWAVQVAARAICAVYWFHPLAWIAWRALCLEAERACDDAVLQSADRADYADQLLGLAQRFAETPTAMLGMAKRSDLSTRIGALLDDRQPRGHAGLLASVGAIATAALVVVAIAPVRAVAAPQDPPRDPQRGLAVTSPGGGTERQREARAGSAIDRALLDAAAEGDADSIEKLLQAGGNVNAKVEGDGSPLIAASRANKLAVVKLLLDRGADPNLGVAGDGAPLIAAAREGNVAVMTLLLDRGANIELVVPGDENAVINACATGHLDAVKLLVGRGANVNAQVWAESSDPPAKGEWRTPLSEARRGRHPDVVAFLLASGAR